MLIKQSTIRKTRTEALTSNQLQWFSSKSLNAQRKPEKGSSISPLNSDTPETLIQKVAESRDKHAYRLLFTYFAPRIKSFLLKQKIADELAEDLTQEVMVTVWQKAHMFDPAKARLSTWMFRIARNKFIDKVRRQKHVEVDVDDHIQLMEAPEKTDTEVIQNQDRTRIMSAMDTLKPELRSVIELSFYQDLSHSQISAQLDLPLGTVKSRMRAAFQRLRTELGDY